MGRRMTRSSAKLGNRSARDRPPPGIGSPLCTLRARLDGISGVRYASCALRGLTTYLSVETERLHRMVVMTKRALTLPKKTPLHARDPGSTGGWELALRLFIGATPKCALASET